MYDGRSSIRPRMAGSMDITVLRTRTSPGPGSRTAVWTSSKSPATGSPLGRAASRISRPVLLPCSVIQSPNEVVPGQPVGMSPLRPYVVLVAWRRYQRPDDGRKIAMSACPSPS